MAAEFHAACETIAPELADKHDRRWLVIVQQIVGDRLTAEVFIRAIDGLCSDTPKPAALRKRINVLVERFAT